MGILELRLKNKFDDDEQLLQVSKADLRPELDLETDEFQMYRTGDSILLSFADDGSQREEGNSSHRF